MKRYFLLPPYAQLQIKYSRVFIATPYKGFSVTRLHNYHTKITKKDNQITKVISNGNRTEWSPIRSVIIRMITKSDDSAAGVRFVYHDCDY